MKPKTATVADLRNNFRRVSAWIAKGESVEIIKRGRSFARLEPIAVASLPSSRPVKIDYAAQLEAVWGDRVFSTAEVQTRCDAERGDHS